MTFDPGLTVVPCKELDDLRQRLAEARELLAMTTGALWAVTPEMNVDVTKLIASSHAFLARETAK